MEGIYWYKMEIVNGLYEPFSIGNIGVNKEITRITRITGSFYLFPYMANEWIPPVIPVIPVILKVKMF